ncbi:MAG: hypothetical protein HYX47_00865 [Burkholderiales bacterium]|nr:hypothetical protein [Burkholderiales bacterium]
MNSETSQSNVSTSSNGGATAALNGSSGTVHRVAQKAHEAVDKLEQTVSAGSEKVTGWQQEYGDTCRAQVKANPLTAVGIAFAAGILFSRILGR